MEELNREIPCVSGVGDCAVAEGQIDFRKAFCEVHQKLVLSAKTVEERPFVQELNPL
jgi:hypothetical protein